MTGNLPQFIPEYLVVFETLEKIALEYGLRLVERRNFHKMFDEEIQKESVRNLYDKMVKEKMLNGETQENID